MTFFIFSSYISGYNQTFSLSIEWIVLDEADKLFEEGKNSFRDQFNKIYAACTCEKIKFGLFSATWTMPVSKWGKKNSKDLNTISIGQRNSATDLVDQELVFVGNEAGKMVAFRNMLREGLKPPVLVFVDSKVRLLTQNMKTKNNSHIISLQTLILIALTS